jgi:peptidoglycan/LPS O-acetylase OafA/YrhL
MAMVVSSHRYPNVADFYLSRFLRIFPTYWLVLFGSLTISILSGLLGHHWLSLKPFFEHPFQNNGTIGIVVASFSNLTIIGQDWIMFLAQEKGHPLEFTSDLWSGGHPLWRYLVMPQSWSIGLELSFYLLVPVLNRFNTAWLVSIALVCTASRGICYTHLNLAHDPWTYRFFPFEIATFILGMLAYRLYNWKKIKLPKNLKFVSTRRYLLAIPLILGGLYLHAVATDVLCAGDHLARYLCNGSLFLAVPFLFWCFGGQVIDRFIGELSYPVYLVHWFIIDVIVYPLGSSPIGEMHLLGTTSAALSLIVSVVIYVWWIIPLDRKRHTLAEAR